MHKYACDEINADYSLTKSAAVVRKGAVNHITAASVGPRRDLRESAPHADFVSQYYRQYQSEHWL